MRSDPPNFGVTIGEHRLLQSVLEEMGDYLGCAERTWIADKHLGWQDDFVLTGSRLGSVANGTVVWRFTPRVPTEFAPHIAPIGKTKLTPWGNTSLAVRLFVGRGVGVASCTVRFDDAVISQESSSPSGWWLSQPAGAPPPLVNCSGAGVLAPWPLAN